MRFQRWIVLLLLLVLITPCEALATESDVKDIDSSEISMDYRLGAGNNTPFANIRYWIEHALVRIGPSQYQIYNWRLPYNLLMSDSGIKAIILLSVTLVFVWWGVRKVIRIILRAFRKGRFNG